MPALSLPFYKLSPGGNVTILIRENSLPGPSRSQADRAAIAGALMDANHLGAEQVGFLDTSRALPHLEMMGGEFCVNATRSAAFVFALLGLLPNNANPGCVEGVMTTSGVADPIHVRVTALPPEISHTATRPPRRETGLPDAVAVEAAAGIPLSSTPAGAAESLVTECAPGEVLVRLPGITHLLLDARLHPLPDSPLAAAAAKRTAYGLNKAEATGVVWHMPGPAGTTAITPVVHVAATMSSVMETACGSGSLAVALLLARSGGNCFALRQPSGRIITVTLESPDAASNRSLAWIGGPVFMIAQGMTHVSW